MAEPLSHIVIAGGGTAGWMTAAALARLVAPNGTRITLVESDEIGAIGVGEASIPPLRLFNQILGIDERDFIRQTKGTFKLGIEFVDWLRPGHRYLHPFGDYGRSLDSCDFHHYWLKAKAAGHAAPLDVYNMNSLLAAQNRFALPSGDRSTPLSALSHAYHFDASLYAAYLRAYAEARGAIRTEGRIAEVKQNAETGFVTALHLADGREVTGDLFIDCTGFSGLLIEKTLKTGYTDWSGLLPCDRAVAVPCQRIERLTPYTRATARAAGWQWRIPLQHRTGNGYVYSSNHVSDDQVARTLLDSLDGPALADPRVIRFQTGRRTEAWNRNVIAIGLSAGFLEPLESTSIHLIQKGVLKLIKCLPDKGFSPSLRTEFNSQTQFEYEDVRDFLVLHYKATEREDTAFWRQVRHNRASDSLSHRMTLFRESGRIFCSEHELFKLPNWLAVMNGQGLRPGAYDPVADALPLGAIEKALDGLRDIMSQTAEQQMSHADFLDRYLEAGR